MRRMSAGSGYQYLLRSVAAGDGNRVLSTPLTRYYSDVGTPPGRWLGSGVSAFGAGQLRPGMGVSEEQLALLVGMGRDPITGVQLGRAYPSYRKLSDRIEGLNSGADDYMIKPFALAELSARLGAVARRYAGKANPLVRCGGIEIDLARRTLKVDAEEVLLSAREWTVLEQFVHRRGTIVTKRQIEDALYAFGAEIESNTVEVYISRLRKKIGYDAIRTLRGLGYRMPEP